MYAAALIDHHPLLRLGLVRILSSIPSIREVRSYAPDQVGVKDAAVEGELPVQILLFGQSGDARYDQALLLRSVAWLQPRQILVLSDGQSSTAPVHERVCGRVRKNASADLIESAVRLILAGGSCFPAPASGAAAQEEAGPGEIRPAMKLLSSDSLSWPLDPPDNAHLRLAGARDLRITPRQFEILALRARGMSLKEVAHTLGIAEATVKAHASAMYRRLNVANQIEAARLANELGIQLTETPVARPR